MAECCPGITQVNINLRTCMKPSIHSSWASTAQLQFVFPRQMQSTCGLLGQTVRQVHTDPVLKLSKECALGLRIAVKGVHDCVLFPLCAALVSFFPLALFDQAVG